MRKTALAASGFALLLALTACGSESTPTTTNTAAQQADTKPASSLFNDAQELVRAASARADEAKSAKFTMQMDIMGMQMSGSGEGSFEGTNSQMSMTMQMMGQNIEMRMVDAAIYMKMPAGQSPGGKPWVKMDLNSAQAGEMKGMLEQSQQSDPRKILEVIQKAGKITKADTVQLDGQEVSHYAIDLDMKKAGGLGGMTEADLAELPEGTIVPTEIWLNRDQLPVQITMDMGEAIKKIAEKQGEQVPAGTNIGGKMTMKYSDWGAPVNVEIPPADQVGEMPR
ncbi:hypothetical protein [Amycolatopsis magusensis]|uniref:hypothetical protein n=1 Tax=Amycolatopsis magusensis TaxID=882444 RepID=UPI0024A908A1|nr:hypothetical protein [Amycolatopsis magusensis]MDI5978683.1 hypothetical protein [Amycolatopsis magusensis]